MPKLKLFPEVSTSILSKVITGTEQCLWSAWFRARHNHTQRPDDFDFRTWSFEHADLVRKEADRLESEGWTVTVESQNSYSIRGSVATLKGKPDIVAVRGSSGLILDAKTGKPKDFHSVQVLLYMWSIPRYFKKFSDIKFDGQVSYKINHMPVYNDQLSDGFVSIFSDMIRLLSGDEPPVKRPSETECKYCKITDEDCDERILLAPALVVETEEF